MPTPYKLLTDLLMSVSTPNDLRAILRDLGKSNVDGAVAWGGGAAVVFSDAVDTLRRYGEADRELFQALVDRAPARLEEIRAVAVAWIGEREAATLRAPAGRSGAVVSAQVQVEQRVSAPPPAAAPPAPTEVELAPLDRPDVLTIRYSPAAKPPFSVELGGQELGSTRLRSPDQVKVDGLNCTLSAALRSMLEEFYLNADDGGRTGRLTMEALNAWGLECFGALFKARAYAEYVRLKDAGTLYVQIVSEDPAILSWPWEAMREPGGFQWGVTPTVRISRLPNATPRRAARKAMPQERVNVLLVTSRPGGKDVDFLQVSGPVVESIAEGKAGVPIEITLLRPPTLSRLQDLLREKPGYFHVLHFDGHGVVSGGQGELIFEDNDCGEQHVNADTLALTLIKSGIDIVLLTACRSAEVNAANADPFAPVATSLLRANVGAVIAMSYKLHVDAAAIFAPEFYRSLAQTGDPLAAATEGRQALVSRKQRRGAFGPVQLDDWLVPVVYENRPYRLVMAKGDVETPGPLRALGGLEPVSLRSPLKGRDADLLWLERATLEASPALVLAGPEGVGCAALAWTYLVWRRRTQGLPLDPIWVSCADHPDLNKVLAAVAKALGVPVGDEGLPPAAVEKMASALNRAPCFVVLEDLSALTGGGGPVPGVKLLSALTRQMVGGPSKIVICARDDRFGLDADLRALRKVRPLSDAVDGPTGARLLVKALRGAGYQGATLTSPDVTELLSKTRGLPELITRIGAYVSDRADALRAIQLLDARAALLDDGKVHQVVDEVTAALRS